MTIKYITGAFIAVTLTTSAFADAGHNFPQWTADNTLPAESSAGSLTLDAKISALDIQPRGKTREQVMQELIQARRDGLVPTGHADYPPSQATIERNRARMKAIGPKWAEQK
ncbi:DUF4148 domain-containing protein [Burkholderia sp. Ac-20365]|uniref:DUF4148 domain-containing protein n=1 Tax=Burkholderia sp. Ac-20365 TaxID=2703897 RepID=UPI00197B5F5D|nr:DUF4148 domain-containing protein [Burkholderia sp. Ac-20365]